MWIQQFCELVSVVNILLRSIFIQKRGNRGKDMFIENTLKVYISFGTPLKGLKEGKGRFQWNTWTIHDPCVI